MQLKSCSPITNLVLVICLGIGLAGCNLPRRASNSTPTLNVTQAYQTVEARLTQASELTPAATNTAAPTDSGIVTTTPTQAVTQAAPPSPSPTLSLSTAAPGCDQAAAGSPIDVTIPDDTTMQPAQAFTKTWRLQNTGTCSWTSSYAVTFFSGEQMGAPSVIPLSGEVKPGQSVDISVDMVAPQSAGSYQGNWKLRNGSNVLFGIGPNSSSPFWVRIVVVQAQTLTPTASAATATSTATATQPAVLVQGTSTLVPADRLDLDANQVNPASGEDLSYESNNQGQHLLVPLGNVLVALYGASQPSLENCRAANLNAAPLVIENLTLGSYFCYRTSQGLPGRARLASFNIDDYSLGLDILTWSIP